MEEERLAATEAVRQLGGSASRTEILRHSTRSSLRKAIEAGELRRLVRGRYVLPDLSPADQAAAATHGLVSHESAAQYWKLEMLTQPAEAHVTVAPHTRHRPRRGVVLHYSEVSGPDDHGAVTSPVRTVLDCARTLPLAQALSIADSALRRALVTTEDLVVAAHRLKGPGRQSIIRVAESADSRAANPFESGLRAILIGSGIRGFEPQCEVQLPSGSIWVDLGDAERRIALEADSFAFHGSKEALLRDCRRYDELISAGWLVLRFGYEHVTLESDWSTLMIKETCALRERAARRLGATSGKGPEAANFRS